MTRTGNLFVISGPSGAGKGTIVHELVKRIDDIWVSISATTRDPRPGEREGVDYLFLSDERFDELVASGGFLEWAHVHGRRYGTPRVPIEEHMGTGEQVILEIEPQGAFQVKEKLPQAHLIFIMPPSEEELRKRLVGRGTEDAHQIESRLETAILEMGRKEEYDVVIVNDNLGRAVGELIEIIDSYAD